MMVGLAPGMNWLWDRIDKRKRCRECDSVCHDSAVVAHLPHRLRLRRAYTNLWSRGRVSVVQNDLISVVIPCYNQAHFLGEAIESVLRQQNVDFEVLVVDDGSTDDTSCVARRYSDVRLIQQPRMKLSGARNTGLRHARGRYIVFLDADDRLLPGALAAGLESLRSRPECAYTVGRYRTIGVDGPLAADVGRGEDPTDIYIALLQRNYIAMIATVMYHRRVFDAVGGFNLALGACEDYDLHLRVARSFPGCHHGALVAEYRRHDANMTGDPVVMLKSSLQVLRSQQHLLRTPAEYAAYNQGQRFWAEYYGLLLAKRAWESIDRGGSRLDGCRDLVFLLWFAPRTLPSILGRRMSRLLLT
jgi:glycosyltransferase involved in cell wall biosynthesis